MSNEKLTQMDESSGSLDELDIAELRKYAKLLGITAQRDWNKEDFVRAVQANQQAQALLKYANTGSSTNDGSPSKLKPGYARVIVHRDPVPGSANSPVPLGLNGRFFMCPRGVEVELPLEYVNVLADAKVTVVRQKKEPSANHPEGEIVEEDILSYPFQVLDISPYLPGQKFNSSLDQRAAVAARKEAFRKIYGKYPTIGELLAWESQEKEDTRHARRMEEREADRAAK